MRSQTPIRRRHCGEEPPAMRARRWWNGPAYPTLRGKCQKGRLKMQEPYSQAKRRKKDIQSPDAKDEDEGEGGSPDDQQCHAQQIWTYPSRLFPLVLPPYRRPEGLLFLSHYYASREGPKPPQLSRGFPFFICRPEINKITISPTSVALSLSQLP